MKFVEGFHTKLVVPEGKSDVQVFDDELPGFGCRKFASGACSYFVKYNVGRQQRRKSLGAVVRGNLKAMRLEASTILAKAHLGRDVVGEANAAAAKTTATLGALVPLYLKARQPELREKSYTEVERYLTKHWAPLHMTDICHLTRKDIVAVLDTMEAKVAADRARAALSGLFGWAIDRGYLEEQPHYQHPL